MNTKVIRFILSRMLLAEAVLLLVPTIIALLYQERIVSSFIISFCIVAVCGLLLGFKKPEKMKFYAREGIVIVASTWILWSLFGALPYFISAEIPSFLDSVFETVAGFTTTGASVITDVEVVPRAMLFWRSFTLWIGGMGVLVFVMAILPMAENNSMHIMRAEMAGPRVGKLVPKIAQTAKILYGIYIALTLILIVFLYAGGMPLFDSVLNAFGTAGTGGYAPRNMSIAYYNSAYLEGVITVFMFLFGLNYNLFFFMIVGKFSVAWTNGEWKVYLGIVLAATAAVTANLMTIYGTIGAAFRYAAFQVVSIMTTSGFVTADYNGWPGFSKFVLLALMIIGACAGSTSGGIKVSRLILMVKIAKNEVRQILRPRSVNIITMDKRRVDDDTVRGLQSFIIVYLMILGASALVVSLNGFDFETTLTSVIASLNNIGAGFGEIGPLKGFAEFSPLSKLVLMFNMLVGRLEIFPIIMLFTPGLWRSRM